MLFLLLLLLYLYLHLPKTLWALLSFALFHRLREQAAHFRFGKRFRPWVKVWGESQSVYLPDFYRLGQVLARGKLRAGPPRVPKRTNETERA